MEVVYHPLAQRDVLDILRYYHGISPRLEDDFYSELNATIARVAGNPFKFHPVGHAFRRANLKRFPYHFLYEVQSDAIRLIVVRHNKRHPDFGLERR